MFIDRANNYASFAKNEQIVLPICHSFFVLLTSTKRFVLVYNKTKVTDRETYHRNLLIFVNLIKNSGRFTFFTTHTYICPVMLGIYNFSKKNSVFM
jgi:hypothetical protein